LSQNTGPSFSSNTSTRPLINFEGSFELKSNLYADLTAYAYAIRNELNNWRASTDHPTGYANKLDYIQALLRGSGASKDTSPRGIIGNDDAKAMQQVSRIAIQNNVPFLETLKELYANKNLNNTVKFSKNIATSIKLLDLTDAKSQLSNAYYQAFGAYPSQVQIENFQKAYNKEAEKQKAKTTTSMTTRGDVTSSLTKTLGEGFTEQEQQQFLANYLVKNFDVATSENLGGQAKGLYDQIVGVHRNNLLAEPDLPAVANVIKDVLRSSDDTVATQKLNDYFAKQRRVAATQYLGVQNQLLAGDDVMTFISPLQEVLRKSFGRTIANNDKLIVSALNYKDDKGNYRPMNEIELNNLIMNDPRYSTSPMAISEAASIGDRLTQKLGR
jgi:hypothetical protein